VSKRAYNFDDKTGRRYGRLVVLGLSYIETLKSGKKRSIWLCQCDCGNKCKIRATNLTCKITKSCGCLAKEKMNDFIQDHVKKAPGIRCRNIIYSSYKIGAKKRKLGFDLSIEQFVELTSKNCFYCGELPSNIKKSEYGHGEFIYNGLDRINNNLGYTLSNVTPCCAKCNFMKRALKQKDFISQAHKISHWRNLNEKE
jgi:hypothetical protein